MAKVPESDHTGQDMTPLSYLRCVCHRSSFSSVPAPREEKTFWDVLWFTVPSLAREAGSLVSRVLVVCKTLPTPGHGSLASPREVESIALPSQERDMRWRVLPKPSVLRQGYLIGSLASVPIPGDPKEAQSLEEAVSWSGQTWI